MGFWNDGVRSRSRSRSRSSSSSSSDGKSHRSRKHSTRPDQAPPQPHRTPSHTSTHSKHYTSRPSFARSASSFFSVGGTGGDRPRGGGPGSSSHSAGRPRSYTSAQPRRGFVARVRKFLRQLYEYMRKHPVKVFVMVIMPLITGGALGKLLGAVGVRMPRGLEGMVPGGRAGGGGGTGERFFARGGARDVGGGCALPGVVGAVTGAGVGESIQGALSIAKMFM